MVANGVLTIATIKSGQPPGQPAGRRGITIPKTLNQVTGVASTWGTGFNDHSWGKATRKFASKAWDIEKEKKGRIKMIIREAQAYVQRPRISCHRDSAGDTQEYDERDFLVDESCSEDDGDADE
jgi:hypothetical protein